MLVPVVLTTVLIFSILSQMQLEYKAISPIIEKPIITASKVEYSIQDVLDLFST